MTPQAYTAKKLVDLTRLMEEEESITFRAACEQVGISYRTAYRHYGPSGRRGGGGAPGFTQESAIEAFKVAVEDMGYVPTSGQYSAAAPPQVSHMTLYRLFGSWDAVLEAAGFEPIRWRARGLPTKMSLTHGDLKKLELV